MSASSVKWVRILSSAALFALLLAFAFALWLGHGRLDPRWVTLLGGVAILGGIIQFMLGRIVRPKAKAVAKPLNGQLEQRSYVVGYGAAVAAFLGLFGLTQLGLLRADTAFFLMGPALVVPSLYRAGAALRMAMGDGGAFRP